MNGKALRLKRFQRAPSGRMVILPLDHGVTYGPIPGIDRLNTIVRCGAAGGVDALVLFKGMLKSLEPLTGPCPGVIVHLSASTRLGSTPHHKVLIGSVEEAIRHGADGVSVQVNLGGTEESQMLRDLGTVSAACAEWQFPLLVMMYVQNPATSSPPSDAAIAHSARVAAELGADIIKIPAPKDPDSLCQIASSLPVPVVIAGGSRASSSRVLLERIEKNLAAGASGVAIGRNVFQHEQPDSLIEAICRMVHGGCSAVEACGLLPAET
jgi:predicted phospho-2-dehydro-3-deoxyheptonate aldolase